MHRWLGWRPRFQVRDLLIMVAMVGLMLGGWDAWRMHQLASRYRERAEFAARMEARCCAIVALDPAARAKQAAAEDDDGYLDFSGWTRRMIPWYAARKLKFQLAADHPRRPLPPDPLPPEVGPGDGPE